jgi:hypothetical protein
VTCHPQRPVYKAAAVRSQVHNLSLVQWQSNPI